MQLTFLGANHEVTGSRTLLNWREGCYALVDCGMEQGENLFENAEMPIAPADIRCVFVTHAHIDHTGKLPQLYRQGFRGKVYATRETTNLCAIMLADSAHIQMMDAEYKNRKAKRAGQPPVEPEYDLEDVNGLMKLFIPCEYGQRFTVEDGLAVRFTDIGHLMGSAAVELWLDDGQVQKKLVFSGDVGNIRQPILNDPQFVDVADYLVLESTYGNRLHAARIDPTPAMADILQRTLDRGGNLIIPSFAVGRTQEMLYLIREIKQKGLVHGHDGFPVYVDSPLANEATAVFLQCDTSCLDPEARSVMAEGENPIAFEGLETVVSAEESKALNDNPTPKVIISASGMCDAGRVRHHLKYNLWREESTVLFVGYQAAGTLGRALQEGAKTVKLFGDEISVKAEIATLQGVSGHADQAGLLRWVDGFAQTPAHIFVNHGEDDQSLPLVDLLKERYGVAADCPYSGSVYDLAADAWAYEAQGVPAKRKQPKQPTVSEAYLALQRAVELLADALPACRQLANKELKRLRTRVESIVNAMNRLSGRG